MGGYGSGRYTRWRSSHDLVEDCRALDVGSLKRDGLLAPGSYGSTQWRYSDGRPAGSISIYGGLDAITLAYTSTIGGGTPVDVSEPVQLSWTRCHLGGRRPWFICPGVVNGVPCYRRVAILYSGGRYFLCRRCYGLAYTSQNEDVSDRAWRRRRRLQRRLGRASDDLSFPPKPSRMHWSTYERLWREWQSVDQRQLAALFHATLALGRLMRERRV